MIKFNITTSEYMTRLKCPYCGYEDYDSWELEDRDDHHECANCGREFAYDSETIREFWSWKPEETEKK